jgi:hypothetical protein
VQASDFYGDLGTKREIAGFKALLEPYNKNRNII